MHYLRAPLVLLATTFVAAVLAIPMANIRRDSTFQIEELTNGFSSVGNTIQDVRDDLAKLSLNSDQPTTATYLDDFSEAARGLETLCLFAAILDPVSEAESQTLMNTTFLPFFNNLNDIVVAPISNVTNNLDPFDFSDFVISLTNIASATNCLQIVVAGLVTPNVATQLGNVYVTIDTTLARTLIGFEIFPYS